MKYVRSHWFVVLLSSVIIIIFICELLLNSYRKKQLKKTEENKRTSLIPDIKSLSNSEQDNLIKYGRDLIVNTANYFGPNGRIAHITNGLNCQNCHMEAGTRMWGNNFLAVSSTYPKYRDRSGRLESVEFRINECMQRSLAGEKIDSVGKEMKAMVAYIKWTGKNVTDAKADGLGGSDIPFLNRAADTMKGAVIYSARCKSCHGANGEGVLSTDSVNYRYPPVWGDNSYAVSAGMYRLTKLASFIKIICR